MLLLTPMAAAAFNALADLFVFVVFSTDCEDCGFENLGLVLFGGVFAAIAVGVLLTVIRLRLREGKTEAPAFISIKEP